MICNYCSKELNLGDEVHWNYGEAVVYCSIAHLAYGSCIPKHGPLEQFMEEAGSRLKEAGVGKMTGTMGTAGCTDCKHYRHDRWHPCAIIVVKGYIGQHIPRIAVMTGCRMYEEET